jgi:hypothetical protein
MAMAMATVSLSVANWRYVPWLLYRWYWVACPCRARDYAVLPRAMPSAKMVQAFSLVDPRSDRQIDSSLFLEPIRGLYPEVDTVLLNVGLKM